MRPFNGVLTPRKVKKPVKSDDGSFWITPECQRDPDTFYATAKARQEQKLSEGHSFAYPVQELP